ncbi:MAG: hypothetical protein IKB37_01385 [Rikenellaceae bacterium]|nr:hypothetical protein [Rikenellaceae bacterium]
MKEKVKRLLDWIKGLDAKLWGDGLRRKSYLGLVSIVLAALVSGLLFLLRGGIGEMYLFVVVLMAVNIIETAFIAKSVKVGVLRSLLMVGLVLAASVASIIVMAAIALVAIIYLVGFVVSLFKDEDSSNNKGGNSEPAEPKLLESENSAAKK